MKSIGIGLFLVFILSCSTNHKNEVAQRKIASLDNYTVRVLDPVYLDLKLETEFQKNENKAFNDVAIEIAKFVTRQSQIRAEHSKKAEKTEQEILNEKDLPQVDHTGQPLAHDRVVSYATRDVHRKTHGCYKAELKIDSSIKENLNAQIVNFLTDFNNEPGARPQLITDSSQLGIFQEGAAYDAVVRYSNGNPGNNFDGEPDARGMALKILPDGALNDDVYKIPAEKLNKATELDILSINFPTFFVNSPAKYLSINQKFLSGAQDYRSKLINQAQQAKAIFGSDLDRHEKKLALLSNGSIIWSSLHEKYFSMVPSRLGPHGEARAVKYAFFPESCTGDSEKFKGEMDFWVPSWAKSREYSLVTRTEWAKRITPPFWNKMSHDYLRENIKSSLATGPRCFALMFQLYRDQKSTSIEDSTDIWLSDEQDKKDWIEMTKEGRNLSGSYYKSLNEKKFSPYVKVASLRILQIPWGYPATNTKTCEDLSFNPWNGRIDYHKPLGVVSRMKRHVYNASRRTRHTINHLPTAEWEREAN